MIASHLGRMYFDNWLVTIDVKKHVRNLSFDFFDCFPEGIEINGDFQLAASCPGLGRLQLSFHIKQLETFDDVEDMIPRYKLHQITECKMLQSVALKMMGAGPADAHERLKRLGEWIQDDFNKQRQPVHLAYL